MKRLAILAAALFLVGCGSPATPTQTAVTTTPPAVAAPPPTTSAAAPTTIPAGMVLNEAGELEPIATTTTAPAGTPFGAANEWPDYRVTVTAPTVVGPVEGKPEQVLVMVDATLENLGAETVDYNPLFFQLQDAEGYAYDPWGDTRGTGKPGLDSGNLLPGKKVRGVRWLTFPSPAQGMYGWGRFMKVNGYLDLIAEYPLGRPGYWATGGIDWYTGFAAKYYGSGVPGIGRYRDNLKTIDLKYIRLARDHGLVW